MAGYISWITGSLAARADRSVDRDRSGRVGSVGGASGGSSNGGGGDDDVVDGGGGWWWLVKFG